MDVGETLFLHNDSPEALTASSLVLIEPDHGYACKPETLQPWSYRMRFVQVDGVHARRGVNALRFAKRVLHAPQISRWVPTSASR